MTLMVQITEQMVEAQESVTTPAGKYDCYKISQMVTSKVSIKIITRSHDWLCPGVGIIKNESYTTDGKLNSRMELIEFNR